MFDVGNATYNAILTACFFGIAALTLAAVIPWRWFGARRISKLARWVLVPVIMLAVVYEVTMPARFNIRVDLLLLIPMYLVVLVASVVRWWRRDDTHRGR